MRTINYEKSLGSFVIKYIDDDEIVEGTINVNDNSLKTNLCKDIIDNEEGTIFEYNSGRGKEKILLLKKNIKMIYDEERDETNLKSIYKNNSLPNELFVHINKFNKFDLNKIYFQYYYKKEQKYETGTYSNILLYGLKKYPMCDNNSPNGYFYEYTNLKNYFILNFLKKYSLYSYNLLVSVPSSDASLKNDNSVALMISDICTHLSYIDGSQILLRYQSIPKQKEQKQRFIETHLNSIKVNGDVRGKNIILMDDITTSGCSLLACKQLLLDAGANSVICFAFGKNS